MSGTMKSVRELFASLAERHSRLLDEIVASSMCALSDENTRLVHENARLRKTIIQEARASTPSATPPPLPAVPVTLPRLKWPGGTSDSDVMFANFDSSSTHIAQGQPLPRLKPKNARFVLPCMIEDLADQSPTQPMEDVTELADHSDTLASPSKGSPGARSRLCESLVFRRHSNSESACAASRLSTTFRNKQKRRIRKMLEMGDEDSSVSAERLHKVVQTRSPLTSLTPIDMSCLLREFSRISETDQGCHGTFGGTVIDFDVLVDCLLNPNLLDEVNPRMFARVQALSEALMTVTVGELIDDATKGALKKEALKEHFGARWETILNGAVAMSILASIIGTGASIDFKPDHYMWIIMEGICTTIFVAEVAVKNWKWGPTQYFCGHAWRWNMLDLCVTTLGVVELLTSIITRTLSDGAMGIRGATVGAAEIGLVLRTLRFSRVLRIVKLLHSPLLRELVNMMVGCVIGMPALLWVLVLFVIILFMSGVFFRIVLGPNPGQNEFERCGFGDDFVPSGFNDDCRVHYMYGEEFFPTVKTSMFTAFRFMIGDYSTHDGKSLAVAFSRGYGDVFHISFCSGMIMVMFGLFNIITAIFVDTVVAGLKRNDVRRKYARQYERKHVQTKLTDLMVKVADCVRRKAEISAGGRISKLMPTSLLRVGCGPADGLVNKALDQLTLSKDAFMEVMEDPHVQSCLSDLDCAIQDPSAVFDTFDPSDSGEVTAAEFVLAVLKLRGEPAKNDMVANWVALRQLHKKVDSVQMMLVESKRSDVFSSEVEETCPR